MMIAQFERLRRAYDFDIVDGSRSMEEINADLRRHIEEVLQGE
jgi:thymidylate kinase